MIVTTYEYDDVLSTVPFEGSPRRIPRRIYGTGRALSGVFKASIRLAVLSLCRRESTYGVLVHTCTPCMEYMFL